MEFAWQSRALATLQESAQSLGDQLAAELGAPGPAIAEVVSLHLMALDAAVAINAPELYAEQVLWQSSRLQGIRPPFGSEDIDRAVQTTLDGLLGADAAEQVRRQRVAAAALTRDLGEGTSLQPLNDLAYAYLDAAMDLRRDDAVKVVRNAMAEGMDNLAIMQSVLRPAQLWLGLMWERGMVNAGEEHAITAITELCLALLYQRSRINRQAMQHVLVGTGIASDAHDLGLRMVLETFDDAGWTTLFIGGRVPREDIVAVLRARRPHVLALSVTMISEVAEVSELITQVRSEPTLSGMRVLVGGRLISSMPRLAEELGADAWAEGPQDALTTCNGWVGVEFAGSLTN